jgi:hypothetical protein
MRFGHLLVRCGPYRILVPGDNIVAIGEVADLALATIPIRRALQLGWPLVMDTRVLLGLDPTGRGAPRVNIQWRSHDGTRRAVLGVDGVDGLRYSDDADVLKLPRVPLNVRGLFDGLVRDGDGFLLQLRTDVSPLLDTVTHRTRFVRAVLGALPPPNTVSNRLET